MRVKREEARPPPGRKAGYKRANQKMGSGTGEALASGTGRRGKIKRRSRVLDWPGV